MTHLSAKAWKDNAELIAEVAAFWNFDEHATYGLDLTYNTGKWWKKWRPYALDKNDMDLRFGDFHFDYRVGFPWLGESFDLVAFDPPYVSSGGRETSTIGDMNTAYGIGESARTPEENQEWINLGLTEAVRLCRVGGFALCKVQDYRSSGKMFLGAHYTLAHALTLPVEVEAIYHHVGKARAQPKTNPNGTPRPQKSPRNNSSTLYLFRKTNNKETAHV